MTFSQENISKSPLAKISLEPGDLAPNMGYKLMTSLVVPRPIGWIGTISSEGVANLAPFSFFNVVSGSPPTFVFSAGQTGRKDTLDNVKAVGEFSVNLVTEEVVEQMNASAAAVEREIDEFDLVGVSKVASTVIRPPLVGECKANFECQVQDIVDIGEPGSGNSLVIGTVVMIHIWDQVFDGSHVDQQALKAVGRHAGSLYSRSTDQFNLGRP